VSNPSPRTPTRRHRSIAPRCGSFTAAATHGRISATRPAPVYLDCRVTKGYSETSMRRPQKSADRSGSVILNAGWLIDRLSRRRVYPASRPLCNVAGTALVQAQRVHKSTVAGYRRDGASGSTARRAGASYLPSAWRRYGLLRRIETLGAMKEKSWRQSSDGRPTGIHNAS
jgi:hypothetical protein